MGGGRGGRGQSWRETTMRVTNAANESCKNYFKVMKHLNEIETAYVF
jgi:hypothetical protein